MPSSARTKITLPPSAGRYSDSSGQYFQNVPVRVLNIDAAAAAPMVDLLVGARELPTFFFNDTATTEIYTLSLHDALPISSRRSASTARRRAQRARGAAARSL